MAHSQRFPREAPGDSEGGPAGCWKAGAAAGTTTRRTSMDDTTQNSPEYRPGRLFGLRHRSAAAFAAAALLTGGLLRGYAISPAAPAPNTAPPAPRSTPPARRP